MNKSQIVTKFGNPTDVTWDNRSFGYKDFFVQVGGQNEEIWHLTLKKNIKFKCGVGIGSSKADVQKYLGSSSEELLYDQYKIYFTYSGNTISKIKIDPANESFKPVNIASANNTAPVASNTNAFTGRWYGIGQTVGNIVIKKDGTYDYNGSSCSTYTVNGNAITFKGCLSAWNNGTGKLDRGSLVFYWQNANGSKNYFTFGKSN